MQPLKIDKHLVKILLLNLYGFNIVFVYDFLAVIIML